MLEFLATGIGLAFNAVVVPGPIAIYMLTVAIQAGWRKALWVCFSPLISDFPVILAALFLLSQMQAIVPSLIQVIQVIGGLVLLWIAWGTWQQLQAGAMFKAKEGETVPLSPLQIVGRAVVINLASPGPYIFWGTINGPILLDGLNTSVAHGLAFLIGFYGTFITGYAILAVVFSRAGQINPRLTRGIMLVAVALLVVFALNFIAAGLGIIG